MPLLASSNFPAVAHGAGEGALPVAEQFALEQFARDRGAVDGHEGPVGPEARKWIALATSSLPVPLSPVIRTVASVSATF